MEKIGENIGNNIQQLGNPIKEAASGAANLASDLVTKKDTGVFSKFSSNKFVSGTKDFLNSNSLVAKVVFILLVLILFMAALRIMGNILHSLFGHSNSPIIVKGVVSGKKRIIIQQDPKMSGAVPILRSDNQEGGIEFTYCAWLMVEDDNYHSFRKDEMKHIFHKGSQTFKKSGPERNYAYPNNCPGVYLDGATNKLKVVISTYEKLMEIVEVPDIPIHKWICLTVRLENRSLDVYINGTIVARHRLSGVPKQNYGNIYVNHNGGFSGLLSNLRYYNRAITITEIQDIVQAGPNMSSNQTLSIFPPYLSMRWFLGQHDN